MTSHHRDFKDRLYAQFARVGKALGSPHRIEILELLAQGERPVDSLAREMGLSLANTSQHLQALRQAALVDSRKEGLFMYYRLAEPAVFDLCATIRRVAARRLADLERLLNQHFGSRSQPAAVGIQDLLERMRLGDVIVLDARPASEYEAGHIAGAISVPIDELQKRLRSLPRDKEYVAYCRGPYCVYADRAVELLTKSRRRARRLMEGFPEWRAAGLPITLADSPARHGRRGDPVRTRRPRRSSA
ncbi:MAG TPA: metalloregulator ArsR/SmtB family transcription factor [Vicinamibacterales bacterium]|jgi:DNA-binding transcriptional ArsR family regulator/rhodanese-related sulfurtransferase|nr:metalloregulator ArsR/SmtB family transcription factor [Vicinamibacterales bacterium]HEX2460698.1 metalloregulator ArsR/SmtB family transcription factor [Vicinamibacterales bacterium]